MNKNKAGKSLLITLMILLFIGAAIFGAYKLIDWIGKRKRASAAPPTVYLTNPKPGEFFPVGQLVQVHASAVGSSDIQVIELRLDGQSAGKNFNDEGTDGDFDGLFEITITDGPHSISVRATDQKGLVGQSIPIQIIGTGDKPKDGLLVYVSQDGDTLESIANDFGVDLDELLALNPELGEGELPPGTRVKIPPINEEEPAPEPAAGAPTNPPAPSNQPPAPPPNTTPLVEIAQALPVIDLFGVIRQVNTPNAPDGLTASHEGCKVTLSWNDNSTNEDYFRVWFGGLGLPARVIATVSSSDHVGPVWFQFNTPPAGIYNFWVEAGNTLGSQPSEEVWLGVPATQCGDFTSAYLYLSVEKLEINGNYDRLYCYISVEGAPEHRFPTDENSFFDNFNQQALWGDFFPIGNNLEAFTIPYPQDGTVDVQGECLAWSGGSLNSLGVFAAILTAKQTEFVDVQTIETPNFRITIEVRPYGWETPTGTYTFNNPNIPAPFLLQIFDTGFSADPTYPSDKYLSWQWQGDENEIEGFTIYMNGNPFKLAMPHERAVTFPSPARCGMHMKFEVAANLPNGQTDRSGVLEYDLLPCSMRAEIIFHTFATGQTNDSIRGKCDTIETYFELVAWGAEKVQRNLGVGSGYSWRFPMTCSKVYHFDDIGYALTRKNGQNRLIVEIDPENPELTVGVFGWDYDWGSANDQIIMAKEDITGLPVFNWQGFEKEVILEGWFTSAQVFIRAIP